MKRFALGFDVRSAIIISLVLLVVVFLSVSYILHFFYSIVQTTAANLIKTVNKGFKLDYFDWVVESINAYGSEILSHRRDEYDYFKRVIEPSLVRFTDSYDIFSTGEGEKEFIASSFYWNGEKLFSEDPSYLEDPEFISFLRGMNSLPAGTKRIYFSPLCSDYTYVCRLNKGVIGGRVHVEHFNEVWLKSVFKEISFMFCARSSSDEGGKSRWSAHYEGFEFRCDPEKFYMELLPKIRNESFDVAYGMYGDIIAFLLVQDYGGIKLESLVFFPVRGIFPLTVWEVVALVSFPLAGLVFLLVFLYNRVVFARIRELSEFFGELGRRGGDLTFRIGVGSSIREVKEVFDNFNEFLSSIEVVIRVSKEVFRGIEGDIEVLSELGGSVEAIRVVMGGQDEVRRMMEEVGSMIGEVSATVEEMMRGVEAIRNNVGRQYGMMEEMSGMVEETIMTVNSLGKRIGKADEILDGLRDEAMRSSGVVRRNVEEVRDVNMFLGNVLEVVDVIKSIADRIEVLSMNASIEAAHAGEAGRGFAVVADEMGSLAEDSRKKAEEVAKLVRDVIDRVREGMEGVEESGEKFLKIADGIRDVSAFVGEINASMVEIVKTNEMVMGVIGNLMRYSEGIKVAMEESSSGMGEMVKAVHGIKEAVDRLNDKFGEVYGVLAKTADLVVGVSDRLPDIVGSLRRLGEELGKFKVSEEKISKGIMLAE